MWAYITDNTSSADEWVYITDNPSMADEWVYITDKTSNADKWIYITDNPSNADKWIYITDNPSYADECTDITNDSSCVDSYEKKESKDEKEDTTESGREAEDTSSSAPLDAADWEEIHAVFNGINYVVSVLLVLFSLVSITVLAFVGNDPFYFETYMPFFLCLLYGLFILWVKPFRKLILSFLMQGAFLIWAVKSFLTLL